MDATKFLEGLGIAVTPLRARLIEVLNDAERALSYDEILAKISANKTTIYRNLQLFEQHGILISCEHEHKNFYELGSGARAYFICDVCHKVTNVDVPLPKEAKSVKSAIIKGVCSSCE